MSRPAAAVEIVPVEHEAAFWDDTGALEAGLREPTPRIPPWYGYDALGSRLFESITELPTYYLTRVERGLLRRHAEEIAERLDCARIAELGSGSAKKTRLLLTACAARRDTTYLPIDVSREMLAASAAALGAALPTLRVTALWGRYEAGLDRLRESGGGPVTICFLGANLGNTTPAERATLLSRVAGTLRPGDGFLVSVDLVKPAEVFETCYNDPPGHTAFADFRRNHLTHLNRRFGADFVPERFDPRAHWVPADATVQAHLRALDAHEAAVPALGLRVHLEAGDSINVGFSAKFDRDGFVDEVRGHGFRLDTEWLDRGWAYGLFLYRRVQAPVSH